MIKSQSNSVPIYFWIVPCTLICVIFYFISQFSINVPYQDHWELTEVSSGIKPLTWSYIWSYHNEHRIIWQKLYSYLWSRLTQWNIYSEAFANGVLIALSALIFFQYLIRHYQNKLTLGTLFIILSSMVFWVCTLSQEENLVLPFQFSWNLIFLVLMVFNFIWKRFVTTGKGLWSIVLLMVISSFSSAHGLVLNVYLIGYACLFFISRMKLKRELIYLSLISFGLLSTYLIGYQKPQSHPNPYLIFSKPIQAIMFCAVYLGNSLSYFYGPARAISKSVGGEAKDLSVLSILLSGQLTLYYDLLVYIVFLLLFIYCLVSYIRKYGRDSFEYIYTQYPLLIIGLMIMAMMAVGRVGFGYHAALVSRYITFSLLITLSVWIFILDFFISQTSQKTGNNHSNTIIIKGLAVMMFMIAVISWGLSSQTAYNVATERRAYQEQFRECVMNHTDNFSACDTEKLYYPSHNLTIQRTRYLQAKGMSFFAR